MDSREKRVGGGEIDSKTEVKEGYDIGSNLGFDKILIKYLL